MLSLPCPTQPAGDTSPGTSAVICPPHTHKIATLFRMAHFISHVSLDRVVYFKKRFKIQAGNWLREKKILAANNIWLLNFQMAFEKNK